MHKLCVPIPAVLGTLYLQTRAHQAEPWATLNFATWSSDLGFLNSYAALGKQRTNWENHHTYHNHLFRIIPDADLTQEELSHA